MRKQAQKNSVTSLRSHTWEGAKPELEARSVWFQSPNSCNRLTVISRNGNLRIHFLASLSFHGGGGSTQLVMASSAFPSLFSPPPFKVFVFDYWQLNYSLALHYSCSMHMGLLGIMHLDVLFSPQVREVFSHYCFKYTFCPFLSFFFLWSSHNAQGFFTIFHTFFSFSLLTG